MRTRRDNERIPVVHTREKRKRKRNENTTVVPYVEREEAIGQLEVYQTISESSALWLNANRGSILNNRRRSASRRRLRRRAPTMSRDVHWLSSPKIHSRLTSYERYRILAIKTDSVILALNSSHFVCTSSLFRNDYILRFSPHSSSRDRYETFAIYHLNWKAWRYEPMMYKKYTRCNSSVTATLSLTI